ncbi:MAG: glycosyltransferase family 1 protein [Pyrinomonadaceae bacterium]
MNAIRVLHVPTDVAGNAQQLARAERELGLDSISIAFRKSLFDYNCDEVLLRPGDSQIREEIKRWQLLWRALRHSDIVHFNFGQTITPKPFFGADPRAMVYPLPLRLAYQWYARLTAGLDLKLLRSTGKKIFVTFQGDDARQADVWGRRVGPLLLDEVGKYYYPSGSDEYKRRKIARFALYADGMYALNPDLLYVLSRNAKFMPYAHVDLRRWTPIATTRPLNSAPVVIHAPSHRGVKGTRFVTDAVARLKAEGVPLEFLLVEGLSNREARKLYERADLLIDQVLIGWYGGLAVEFMALGKPVVCYIREADLKFIPGEMAQELPIIRADHTSLYDTLKVWLTQRRLELPEIGDRSRAYVERWHNPMEIAKRLKADYEVALFARPS